MGAGENRGDGTFETECASWPSWLGVRWLFCVRVHGDDSDWISGAVAADVEVIKVMSVMACWVVVACMPTWARGKMTVLLREVFRPNHLWARLSHSFA